MRSRHVMCGSALITHSVDDRASGGTQGHKLRLCSAVKDAAICIVRAVRGGEGSTWGAGGSERPLWRGHEPGGQACEDARGGCREIRSSAAVEYGLLARTVRARSLVNSSSTCSNRFKMLICVTRLQEQLAVYCKGRATECIQRATLVGGEISAGLSLESAPQCSGGID